MIMGGDDIIRMVGGGIYVAPAMGRGDIGSAGGMG